MVDGQITWLSKLQEPDPKRIPRTAIGGTKQSLDNITPGQLAFNTPYPMIENIIAAIKTLPINGKEVQNIIYPCNCVSSKKVDPRVQNIVKVNFF
jgi:hypothetical protein